MKSISKKAFQLYSKNFAHHVSLAIMYGLFLILTAILGFLFPLTYILTVPLVILPITYGYNFAVASLHSGQYVGIQGMLFGYKLYFSPMGYGCFHCLIGLLKGFVTFLIVYTISSSILLVYQMDVDPAFRELINNVQSVTNIEQYKTLLNELASNPTLIRISNIAMMIGFVPGLMFFVHNLVMNSLKAIMSFSANKEIMDMKSIKYMHSIMFSRYKWSIYKDYYSSLWFVSLIFLVSLTGGLILVYFVFNDLSIDRIITVGATFSLLINLLLIPYVTLVMDEIYLKNAPKYVNASMQLFLDSYDKLMQSNSLSKEEKAKLEEMKKEMGIKDKEKDQDK